MVFADLDRARFFNRQAIRQVVADRAVTGDALRDRYAVADVTTLEQAFDAAVNEPQARTSS